MTSLSLPAPSYPAGSNDSALKIAQEWFDVFAASIDSRAFAADDHFIPGGFWRDLLALTSTHRTCHGSFNIDKMLHDRLDLVDLSDLRLVLDGPSFVQPFPDLTFLVIHFGFKTRIGEGQGICRLVQQKLGEWKAYTVFTCLEQLRDYPQKAGARRPYSTMPVGTNGEVDCLVVGGGHSGLEAAARLQALGLSTIIVEKNSRVGDNWRLRYKSLHLHGTSWYNQTPYLPFPSTWPVYGSAQQLANFLEGYAYCLDLNVLTSSEVQSARWNTDNKTWSVSITTNEVTTKTLQVRHLIFATGFGCPKMPNVSGKDVYRGTIMHSSEFESAASSAGKKVIVVGSGNSAHDICVDFVNHDADVTMYQRSSAYVISLAAMESMFGAAYSEGVSPDFSDRMGASLSIPVVTLMQQRITTKLASTIDKDIYDGLARTEFKTNLGPDGAGILQLFLTRAGGYYLDTGASKYIIDGSIKVKHGSSIRSFDESGLVFEDGTRLEADIVIFATGYGDTREVAQKICGPAISSQLKSGWGLNEEGELNSAWADSGHEGLWFATGNLQSARFYSTFMAMRIKAIEEGILPCYWHG